MAEKGFRYNLILMDNAMPIMDGNILIINN